ncbi:hypothetical protein [Vibrio sp. A1-1]|uniref:hypothetical protein n=1 Tax=Vibrio sp. A1-1 TaxID=2912250 RepID=UPI001F2EA169|nr:hypothetical protein [Vibrio sp. A1-1]MCF7451905.1 hypothetical protein [Vibrio sp. A1-1]
MQIDELYSLTKWFTDYIQPLNLPNVLSKASTAIKNTKATKASELNKVAQERLSGVVTSLERINYQGLTANQRRCLTHLDLNSILMEGSVRHYEVLFSMTQADANHVITTLDSYVKVLQKAGSALNQIHGQLPVVFDNDILFPTKVPEGKVLTRITFHNEASINNLVEFNHWAKSWNMIARGFSMSVGEAPETFEVVNADRGSFIVDLVVGAEAMKVLFEALKAFTDLAISITDLAIKLKHAIGLRGTVPEDLYDKFVAVAKENIEKEEQRIVEKVIETLQEKKLIQNPEAKNELARAIKEMYKFNAQGGTMHCLASNDEVFDEDSIKQLNESYHQLQDKSELKLIEDKKADKDG